jgi:hypothetical protein
MGIPMRIGSEIFCDIRGNVEMWRTVVGGEEIYAISNTGNARSRRIPRSGKRFGHWRLLKPMINSYGYLRVSLYLNGKKTTRLIHHLVADAFLPPKGPTDTVVRHLNDDKLDNRVENLARGTYSDNMADSIHNGKHVVPKGVAHYRAKLTEDNVREIRRLYATGNFTQRELALHFGVSQKAIWQIVLRTRWKHVA